MTVMVIGWILRYSITLRKEQTLYLSFILTLTVSSFVLKGAHNIGIAMATPNGLVVPNIKKVQTLSILEVRSSGIC